MMKLKSIIIHFNIMLNTYSLLFKIDEYKL